MNGQSEYLTEEKMSAVLERLFPDDFIRDKSVPGSVNKRLRADFRSDSRMMIIEFDGFGHYTSSNQIKRDQKKDGEYSALGYRVFRIPYFVQLSPGLSEMMFGDDSLFDRNYPDGFIDGKAVLPADFCELGTYKFLSDLDRFDYCRVDILKSLSAKISELGDAELVLSRRILDLF